MWARLSSFLSYGDHDDDEKNDDDDQMTMVMIWMTITMTITTMILVIKMMAKNSSIEPIYSSNLKIGLAHSLMI